VFFETHRMTPIHLVWNKGNMPAIRKGHDYRSVSKKTDTLQIYIKNDGEVLFKVDGSSIKRLSLQNISKLIARLNKDLSIKLFTMRSDQEWIEKIMKLPNNFCDNPASPSSGIGNNILRSCSSLQKFINKINLTDHILSASWFEGYNFNDILEIMQTAVKFYNPIDFFKNIQGYYDMVHKSEGKGFTRGFDDDPWVFMKNYMQIQDALGEKCWFSLKRETIRKHLKKAFKKHVSLYPRNPNDPVSSKRNNEFLNAEGHNSIIGYDAQVATSTGNGWIWSSSAKQSPLEDLFS